MKSFDAAYLRLTGWYVVLIMAISLLFSVWVYNQARNELRFGLGRIVPVQREIIGPNGNFSLILNERLDDSRHRLIARLIGFNTGVLVVGAAASYWLARRTLQPIEDAVQAQHRFTADASHELRTPLAAMKAEIEVGLRDGKLTKDEAVALLRSNLEEIDRLGGLAEGLLTLTQRDEPIELRPVSLEEVCAAAVKRLQPLAGAKQITIVKELQPIIVSGNEAELDKILGILLDNAIKYSSAKTTITIRTYRKEDYGYAEVADQGIGMKASELPHIFDRFYRADSSRSKQHVTGHGLGLSIAQRLAEDLQATVRVTSEPGRGSIFTLRLHRPA